MKKLTLLVVILLTLCLVFGTTISTQASVSVVVSCDSDYASTVIEEFLTDNPSRAYGTSGEYDAGQWIYSYFEDIGLYVSSQKLSTTSNNDYSYNIVASIDTAGTDDAIIIGAHYDTLAIAEGATDNATGLSALLIIAEQLYANKDSLQCDIIFVAFAGEEAGMYGSYTYVYSMSDTEIANTKLMINMDSIGNGDTLMVQGELIATDYVDSLIAGAASSDCQLEYKPFYKGVDFYLDAYGYGYYEMSQNSDHTPFAMAGIPTAFYFSGTYDTFGGEYAESVDADNCIMNTANDTWENLTDNGTSTLYAQRIATVVDSVCNAVLTDCNTLLDAPNQVLADGWFDYTTAYIVSAVIFGITLIAGIVYYKKLDKTSVINGASGATGAGGGRRVFTKPDSEDIFDLGDD